MRNWWRSISRSKFCTNGWRSRTDTVRCMLLSLAAPPGQSNTQFTHSNESRKSERGSSSRSYCTTRYAIWGKAICRNKFLAITQICPTTLSRRCSNFSSTSTFRCYVTKRVISKKGSWAPNAIAVIAFLANYSIRYSLIFPKGRTNVPESCVRILPFDTTKAAV